MTLKPDLPFRRGVGLCLFNNRGQVLCAERRDCRGAWQMPQGGVQKDEILAEAALRELKEEIGTDQATIIGFVPEILSYEFPDYLQYRGGVFRGKYRGQRQVWLALLFTGTDADIDLSGKYELEKPEFSDWKWVELAETPSMIVEFKRDVYRRMVTAFTPFAERIKRGETPPAVTLKDVPEL